MLYSFIYNETLCQCKILYAIELFKIKMKLKYSKYSKFFTIIIKNNKNNEKEH